MINLPRDLQCLIYEYDSTYRELYSKIAKNIRMWKCALTRSRREKKRFSNEFILQKDGIRKFVIQYKQQNFIIQLPIDYPFTIPIVYKDGQKLCPYENWSGAMHIEALIRSYEVDNYCLKPCTPNL